MFTSGKLFKLYNEKYNKNISNTFKYYFNTMRQYKSFWYKLILTLKKRQQQQCNNNNSLQKIIKIQVLVTEIDYNLIKNLKGQYIQTMNLLNKCLRIIMGRILFDNITILKQIKLK